MVIGGGPAGCAAAITLARAGCQTVLLEREREATHKVCGEFLSVEALEELRAMEIDPARRGAEPISTVRVAGNSPRVVRHSLPFPACSLTRRSLDAMLLERAQACGVEVRSGCAAESIEPESALWRVQTRQGSLLTERIVLATGKHNLRGYARGEGRQRGLVGLKMYFHLADRQRQELTGHVELLLYPGGYAGLQPVECGVANLCCLIQARKLQQLGGWPALLEHMQRHCTHLRARLAGAVPVLEKPLAISSIPYGFQRRSTPRGVWCVGDQAAVIPSFTGDGMSLALVSGRRAAQAILRGDSSQQFQHDLHESLAPQIDFATRLSQIMLTGAGRFAAERLLRFWPGAIGHIASRTRLQA